MYINTFSSCAQVHKRKNACTISRCAIKSKSFVENETWPTGRQREREQKTKKRERETENETENEKEEERERENERARAHSLQITQCEIFCSALFRSFFLYTSWQHCVFCEGCVRTFLLVRTLSFSFFHFFSLLLSKPVCNIVFCEGCARTLLVASAHSLLPS